MSLVKFRDGMEDKEYDENIGWLVPATCILCGKEGKVRAESKHKANGPVVCFECGLEK